MQDAIKYWTGLCIEKYREEGIKRVVVDSIIHTLIGVYVSKTREIVDCHGVRIPVSNPYLKAPTIGTFSRGIHESEEVEMIHKHLSEDAAVIELGAGVGVLSCVIDDIIEDSTFQLAVEPNRHVVELLKNTKDINNCNFMIKQAAYSPDNSTVSFPVPKNYKHGSVYRDSDNIDDVDGRSLESIIAEYEIGDFNLVVDIEGYEIPLIRQEAKILAEHCRLLIVEFHGFYDHGEEDIAESRSILESAGFELVDRAGNTLVYDGKT